MKGDTAIILVTVVAVVVVAIVFAYARVHLAYVQAGDAKAMAEKEARKEREENLRLKEELKAMQMDEQQVAIVKANASEVEDYVPPHLKLDWKVIKFIERIGSVGLCLEREREGERRKDCSLRISILIRHSSRVLFFSPPLFSLSSFALSSPLLPSLSPFLSLPLPSPPLSSPLLPSPLLPSPRISSPPLSSPLLPSHPLSSLSRSSPHAWNRDPSATAFAEQRAAAQWRSRGCDFC